MGIDFNTLKGKAMQQQECRALEKVAESEFIELLQPCLPVTSNQHIAEMIAVDGTVLKFYAGSVSEIIKAFKQP